MTTMASMGVTAATIALCDLLEAENAALMTLDIPAVNALVTRKQQATDALTLARKTHHGPLPADLRPHAIRLKSLVADNKALLERAMAAQGRVLACIARAVPRATAGPAGYGARGQETRASAQAPVALSSRA